jgi:RHS repeat-associated protein
MLRLCLGLPRNRRALCAMAVVSIVAGVVPASLTDSVTAAAAEKATTPPPTLPPADAFPATPTRYLPPPTQLAPQAAAAPAQSHAAPLDPKEGWTADTHWVSDGHGHVTSQLYLAPVFRQDSSGWHAVDATVHANASPTQPLSAENAFRPVRFGNNAQRVLEFALDGGPVTLSAPGLQISKPQLGADGTVTYAGVAAATDLHYTVSPSGVKEEVVLGSAAAPTSFTFVIKDPTGQLGAPHALGTEGPFIFDHPIAPQVFLEIGKAFAYEQSHVQNDPSSAHISMTAVKGGWQVIESVDPTWLAGRQYPIILDPSIYQPITLGNAYNSAQIVDWGTRNEMSPGGCGTSCGAGPGQSVVDVGSVNNTWQGQVHNYYDRAVFRYDLSGIPNGSDVSSAWSYWWNADCNGGSMGAPCPGTESILLRRYAAAFPFSGTNMQTIINNTDNSLDVASSGICSPASYNFPCRMQFDLKDQVGRWVTGANPNNGLVAMGAQEGTNTGGPVWYTSYYPPQSGIAKYPELDVTYSPPPSAPSNVQASSTSTSSATVSWNPASTQGGDGITGYTITTFTSSGTNVGSTTACSNCTSKTIGGLTPGTSYYFTVYASNGWTNGPSAQSNTIAIVGPPLIAKTSDFTGAYMVAGQGTTFHVRVTSPGGTTPVSSISDVLPSGFAFGTSAIGAVHISSSVSGVPTTCAPPSCTLSNTTLSNTTLSLSLSPIVNLGPSDYLQIDYPAVAVDTGRGCLSEVNTATVTNQYGSTPASLAITTCESGLGFENYWRYVTRSLGGQGKAAINVASGNLVVQQDDSTPIQAHGRLAFVLRRTYNSADTAVATLPGTLGSGWQFNVSESDDIVGDSVGASGLYLPNVSTVVGSPFAVTLVDRDGTRHVYQPNGLSVILDVQSLSGATVAQDVASGLGTLYPLNISLAQSSSSYHPAYPYNHICVDQTYTPPAGVHMWLWRYIAVDGQSGAACTPVAGTTAAIAGYGAETTDRIHYEFSADGHLLAMADEAGNRLVYAYGTRSAPNSTTILATPPYPDAGSFDTPTSITEPSTGRTITFTPTWNGTLLNGFAVADPAGRTTTYKLDGDYPSAHLIEVDNPDASRLTYKYGTSCAASYGASTNAAANQMCSETDLRGNTTYFTYTSTSSDGVAYPQLPRANAITDRRESGITVPANRQDTTQLGYFENTTTNYVRSDLAGERQRFMGIDGFGRVSEIDEGTTGDQYIHTTTLTWDGTTDPQTNQVTYCRQPDGGRDNNLCHSVRQDPGFSAPDQNTTYTYGDEGQLLAAYQCLGSATSNPSALPPCTTTLDTTSGYSEQYFETTGTVSTFSDTDTGYSATTGHAAVTSTNRGGSTPSRIDGATVFAVIAKTQDVPPRGNAAPPSGQTAQQQVNTYQTTYRVDASTSAAPSTVPPGSVCPSSGTNTGLLCETDGPAFDTSGAATITRYTYEQHGQRATMTTPRVASLGGGSYQYEYYPDPSAPPPTDNTQRYDLSTHTAMGGWLKLVKDPNGAFVAYGYDAAGNAVRVWDRNATQSNTNPAAYPGTASSPPVCSYIETRYATGTTYAGCPSSVAVTAFANPWRYVLYHRDPLGDTTTSQLDADGNVTMTRPPRGNAANGFAYDVSQAFDANDNLTCHLLPFEGAWASCARTPPSSATTYSYDAFNNRTVTLDPRGHYAVNVYDSVNRNVQQWFSRGPMPSDSTLVPAGCHQAGQTGDPSQYGSGAGTPMICNTRTNYDDVDNLIGSYDANAQTTSFTYDSVHRKTQQATPRDTGVTETHAWLYDADGHATDDCPPREFTEGSSSCTSSGVYSSHSVYDASGRVSSTTTYRSAGTPDAASMTYDADGNVVARTDPNGVVTRDVFDNLDRKTSETQPRGSNTSFTTSWNYDAVGNVTSIVRPGPSPVNTGFTQLVIDGAQYPQSNPYLLTGSTTNYASVTLQNGGWMTAPPYSGGSGGVVQLVVGGDVSICSNCGITVAGKGPAGGAGNANGNGAPGSGQGGGGGGRGGLLNGITPTGGAGGGAGHSGSGDNGTSDPLSAGSGGAGGTWYGLRDQSDTGTLINAMGSGGGGGGGQLTRVGGNGGAGGGFVRISAETMEVNGVIDASGAAGSASSNGAGGGGGSGANVWLTASRMTLASNTVVLASGGGGGSGINGVNGGAGASGQVRLDYNTLNGWRPVNFTYQAPIQIVTAYGYDADNRLVDTVQASDSLIAADAGVSDGAHNVRTRVVYDPDGHVVAQFEPRAFVASSTTPDPLLMTRTDFDADGRASAVYVPRYDNGTDSANDSGRYSDLGLSGTSGTQSTQCPTGLAPQAIAGVPSYPSGVGLCVTTVTYDQAGNRATITTPTSRSGSSSFLGFTYTDDNLVASVEAPNPSSPGSRLIGATPAMRYAYDGDGRTIQTTDANGNATTTNYFSDGLVKSTLAQPGLSVTHTTTYAYDGNGNRTSVTDPAGNTSTSAYFADNRLKSTSDPLGDQTSYVYDNDGQPTTVTSPSANATDLNNSSGTPSRYCYTQDHLVAMSLLPVSSDGSLLRQTTYKYDDAGRKIEQEIQVVPPPAPSQACVPQSRTSPGGPTFSYFDDGRISVQTGRNGERMAFTYDAAGHLASAWDSGSNLTVNAAYYLDGVPRSVDDGYRQTKYMADGNGQPTLRVESVDGSSTSYSTTYTYNPAELAASMASTIVPGTTQWSYDAGGRMTAETDGNGQRIARAYNTDNTLASQTVSPAVGNAFATWNYLYDANYRITQQQFGGSGASGTPVTSTYCYRYDNASRVSGFQSLPPGSACGTVPTNVGRDRDGNRTSYTDASGNQTQYCYNADDSVVSIQPGATRNCASPPSGSKSVQYAPFGGLVDDGCATYNYDGFDRLGTVTPKSGVSGCNVTGSSYLYDGLSRQYQHGDSGILAWLHYDGLSLQPALDSTSAGYDTVYELSPSGTPKAAVQEGGPGTLQYLADDGHGNISTATTPGQGVACTIRLDPFGNAVQSPSLSNPCNTGSTPDPFVYRGARHDSATGDYQLGARTYDPAKSSFLTPDTYLAGQPPADLALGTDPLTNNRYNYVNGDPVNLVDPNGHNPCRSDDCDLRTNYENAVADASGGRWATNQQVSRYSKNVLLGRFQTLLGAIPAGAVPRPGPNPDPYAEPSWQDWESQIYDIFRKVFPESEGYRILKGKALVDPVTGRPISAEGLTFLKPDIQLFLGDKLDIVVDAKQGMQKYVGPGGPAEAKLDLYQRAVAKAYGEDVLVMGAFRPTDRGGPPDLYFPRTSGSGVRIDSETLLRAAQRAMVSRGTGGAEMSPSGETGGTSTRGAGAEGEGSVVEDPEAGGGALGIIGWLPQIHEWLMDPGSFWRGPPCGDQPGCSGYNPYPA